MKRSQRYRRTPIPWYTWFRGLVQISLAGLLFVMLLHLVQPPTNADLEENIQDVFLQMDQNCIPRIGARTVATFTNLKPAIVETSTCNDEVTALGPNQKVVSYSFFGDPNVKKKGMRNYFSGIARNAALIPLYYPGWRMRVYHDLNPETYPEARDELTTLSCTFSYLDLCYVGNLPGYGNLLGSEGSIWRFLALSDPLVELMVSRDLDSQPDSREQAAVSQWIQSNASLHIMRDHPNHGVPMLAGMWGAKLKDHRQEWRKAMDRMMVRGKKSTSRTADQKYLSEEIWPWATKIKGFVMQHDSYSCTTQKFRVAEILPFPTQREMKPQNFVGSLYTMRNVLKRECPNKCRKKPDWNFC